MQLNNFYNEKNIRKTYYVRTPNQIKSSIDTSIKTEKIPRISVDTPSVTLSYFKKIKEIVASKTFRTVSLYVLGITGSSFLSFFLFDVFLPKPDLVFPPAFPPSPEFPPTLPPKSPSPSTPPSPCVPPVSPSPSLPYICEDTCKIKYKTSDGVQTLDLYNNSECQDTSDVSFLFPLCEFGTDCTDCGPRFLFPSPPSSPSSPNIPPSYPPRDPFLSPYSPPSPILPPNPNHPPLSPGSTNVVSDVVEFNYNGDCDSFFEDYNFIKVDGACEKIGDTATDTRRKMEDNMRLKLYLKKVFEFELPVSAYKISSLPGVTNLKLTKESLAAFPPLPPFSPFATNENTICIDDCMLSPEKINNGICDDGSVYSETSVCEYGYDCTDCGPREDKHPWWGIGKLCDVTLESDLFYGTGMNCISFKKELNIGCKLKALKNFYIIGNNKETYYLYKNQQLVFPTLGTLEMFGRLVKVDETLRLCGTNMGLTPNWPPLIPDAYSSPPPPLNSLQENDFLKLTSGECYIDSTTDCIVTSSGRYISNVTKYYSNTDLKQRTDVFANNIANLPNIDSIYIKQSSLLYNTGVLQLYNYENNTDIILNSFVGPRTILSHSLIEFVDIDKTGTKIVFVDKLQDAYLYEFVDNAWVLKPLHFKSKYCKIDMNEFVLLDKSHSSDTIYKFKNESFYTEIFAPENYFNVALDESSNYVVFDDYQESFTTIKLYDGKYITYIELFENENILIANFIKISYSARIILFIYSNSTTVVERSTIKKETIKDTVCASIDYSGNHMVTFSYLGQNFGLSYYHINSKFEFILNFQVYYTYGEPSIYNTCDYNFEKDEFLFNDVYYKLYEHPSDKCIGTVKQDFWITTSYVETIEPGAPYKVNQIFENSVSGVLCTTDQKPASFIPPPAPATNQNCFTTFCSASGMIKTCTEHSFEDCSSCSECQNCCSAQPPPPFLDGQPTGLYKEGVNVRCDGTSTSEILESSVYDCLNKNIEKTKYVEYNNGICNVHDTCNVKVLDQTSEGFQLYYYYVKEEGSKPESTIVCREHQFKDSGELDVSYCIDTVFS